MSFPSPVIYLLFGEIRTKEGREKWRKRGQPHGAR